MWKSCFREEEEENARILLLNKQKKTEYFSRMDRKGGTLNFTLNSRKPKLY